MMVIDKKLKPFCSILETYSDDKVYLMNLLANWAIKVSRGKNGLWEFHECAGGGCYIVHELSHSGITPWRLLSYYCGIAQIYDVRLKIRH